MPACSSDEATIETQSKEATGSDVAEIMQIPDEDIACFTGGVGHKECKVEPGVKIGDYVTIGCGVACDGGYYACCGLRCICRPEDAK